MYPSYIWYGFIFFVICAVSIDLFLLSRHKLKQNFSNTTLIFFIWFLLAVGMNIIIYLHAGKTQSFEFSTAYLVELSLSIDNVFVFIVIFKYFKIPLKYQHRLLFWGIFGAIILRLLMITGGVYLVRKFDWIFLPFGLLLIYSAVKLITMRTDSDEDLKDNKIIKFLQKHFNFTDKLHRDKFVVFQDGKRFFTPLVITLILIEKADVIFAVDSIPAVLAISQEPFIVFSSNIFAILGLRAIYFMLANTLEKFSHIKYAITAILIYIGIKMIISTFGIHIPTYISLYVIISSLLITIISSIMVQKSKLQ